MSTTARETEYDFTLVLRGITDITDKAVDALYEAGCDDGTISVRSGCVFLTFSRRAGSLKDAIVSAIHDVRKANIGADVIRVDISNLVTQSDIARRIGRTRQLVHQYMTGQRGPGGFPPPACNISERAPLWNWCEVAYWLWQNDLVSDDVVREANEVAAINNVLELSQHKRLDPEMTAEVLQLL